MNLSTSQLFLQVVAHVREGRFERSLAFITGASAVVSGLEVALEHYHGSFGQKIMYSPLIFCALLGAIGLWSTFDVEVATNILPWVSLLLLLDGFAGFFFHLRGVARKPGGWSRNAFTNVVMGPPLFAPILLGISAVLGLVASHLAPEESQLALPTRALERLRESLAAVAAVSALLNGGDAFISHYKARFASKSQWIPIVLAPLLFVVGGLAVFYPAQTTGLLQWVSLLAICAGLIGTCFHLNGIRKRPGGARNLFYRIVYGPPPFAPMLFAASGFFGLLATQIGRAS